MAKIQSFLPRVTRIKCRQCGATNLHWDDSIGSWRLHDNWGLEHKCKFSLEDVLEVMIAFKEIFKRGKKDEF